MTSSWALAADAHRHDHALLVVRDRTARVVERESHDLVEHLRGIGKTVDYLVFEDEGHDVLKLGNRVRYERIVGFFSEHLSS